MRRSVASVVGLLALLAAADDARAEPTSGAILQYGEALGPQADHRAATAIFVTAPVGRGVHVGGELAGSLETFMDGFGCGTDDDSIDSAAVAVVCLRPTVALHALVGTAASPTEHSELRAEFGLGATSLFLAGTGMDTRRTTLPSGLVRVAYVVETGRWLDTTWRVGVALEERLLGLDDQRLARSLGFVLESAD